MKRMIVTTVALCAACGAFGKDYFLENFLRQPDGQPKFLAEKCTTWNDPIWANCAWGAYMNTDKAPMFVEDIALPDKALSISFRCRFMNDETETIEVVFKDAEGKETSLPVTRQGANVEKIGKNKVIQVAIKLAGGNASLFQTDIRQFAKEPAITAAVGKAVALNFRSAGGFSITDIAVSDAKALPSWPASALFADSRAIKNDTLMKGATPTQACEGMALSFAAGIDKGIVLREVWSDGTEVAHKVKVDGMKIGSKLAELPAATNYPNAFVEFDGLVQQYIRPDLGFFSRGGVVIEYTDLLRDIDRLPKASDTPLTIAGVPAGTGAADIYINGSYIKTIKSKKEGVEFKGFKFKSEKPVAVKVGGIEAMRDAAYVPLALELNPKAKTMFDAKVAAEKVGGIPMNIVQGVHSADVGFTRQGKGMWALEVNEYTARTPSAGFPCGIQFRLPAAHYTKAWIACALDPDASKDPVLTVRLTRYSHNGVSANQAGAVTINGIPEGTKQIGTVDWKGKKLPLYLLEVELPAGDIMHHRGYIDFELAGKQWINMEQYSYENVPDPNSRSAFNIFGITLRKSPVLVDFKQLESAPGNVFTVSEKKSTSFELTALAPCTGSVKWQNGEKKFSLAKVGDKTTVEVAINEKTPGLYEVPVTIEANGAVLTHVTRFAVLQDSTRKATRADSPYGTWWFNTHGSCGDWNIGGPMLKKAGIHRVAWNTPNAENMVKYDTIGHGQVYLDPKTEKGRANFAAAVTNQCNPGTHVMIWHESAPGYHFPPEELIGEEIPKIDEGQKKRMELFSDVAAFVRKEYPNLRIQPGNSAASVGAVILPMRAGNHPDLIDVVGIETPAQVIAPERLMDQGLQGMMITKDALTYYREKAGSKKPAAVNGCWEYVYRCDRDMGEEQQAEWYMRDALISLANKMANIGIGIFFDCSSAYADGLWGGSGLIKHSPYTYPKKAYVAYAALTEAIDVSLPWDKAGEGFCDPNFCKQIPTGSTTVYALSFPRKDGRFATALWCARGEADITLDVTKGDAFDMYGRKLKELKTISTAPTYFISKQRPATLAINARRFPADDLRAEMLKVAAPLAEATEWENAPDADFVEREGHFPMMQVGDFKATAVTDEEKGECVEIAFASDDTKIAKHPTAGRYITEFTTINIKDPKPCEGEPIGVGVWVKGNDNWGQIRFTIRDAEGEYFKGISTGGWGCDVYDWPGNLSVNFDGWCFIAAPLIDNTGRGFSTLYSDHSPGPLDEQWCAFGKGNRKIDYPITITAITIGQTRQKLNILDFDKTVKPIRIKDVGGVYEKSAAK